MKEKSEKEQMRKWFIITLISMASRIGAILGVVLCVVYLLACLIFKWPVSYGILLLLMVLSLVVPNLYYAGVYLWAMWRVSKKRIPPLDGAPYKFLYENEFTLNDTHSFDGVYKDFHISVKPDEDILLGKHNIIECYFDSPYDQFDYESLSGEYYFGFLDFYSNSVLCMGWNRAEPDFEKIFDGLITLMKREKLIPLSRADWEVSYQEMTEAEAELRMEDMDF